VTSDFADDPVLSHNDPNAAPNPGGMSEHEAVRRLQERLHEHTALIENSPDVLVRYDRQKRIVYINKAGERHAGMAAEFLAGKTFREAGFPDEIIPIWEAALDVVLRTGERHTTRFTLRHPTDGVTHHYESVLTPELSRPPDETAPVDFATVTGVVAITRDVTERTEAEHALRESEERLRLALASGNLGAWDADLVAGSLTLSEDIGPLYGRPRVYVTIPLTEWVGEWLHPDDRERIPQAFAAALRGESDYDVQFRTIWPDGVTSRWVATRALVTRDAQGNPMRAVGYTRDVTQDREQQAERDALVARQRSFMRDMVFSLSEGKFNLCLAEADLPAPLAPASDVVELTVPTLRVLRKKLNAVTETLRFAKERGQDVETAVGEAAMNAATHGGGGEGWVCADPEGTTIQVWIRDVGKGISEEALPRVLEKGVSTAGTLGHGFWLMLRTCDRVYLLTGPRGTTVVLEMNRDPPEPAWLQSFG
jgi:PAS domain S-box-containing protein